MLVITKCITLRVCVCVSSHFLREQLSLLLSYINEVAAQDKNERVHIVVVFGIR